MLAELRLITVTEYHQMAEAGILNPDERVELIDGQILKWQQKAPPIHRQQPVPKHYLSNS